MNLQNSNVPILSGNKNQPDHDNGEYTYFTSTGLFADNFGQGTAPFIDIQPVVMSPLAALEGVSLDIKKTSGTGGLLFLKLHSYNVLNLKQ